MSDLTRWADQLEATLGDGRRIEVYPATASTQDIAKARASERLLVVANHQTAGRGRLGRRWLAPPGAAALFSFNCQLADDTTLDRVSFLAALGTARAIESLTPGLRVGIKWPNDLVITGRKLAGILIEAVGRSVVIGVGINAGLSEEDAAAMPDALRDRVTSLAMLGRHVPRPALIAQVVSCIDACLSDTHLEPLVAEWRDRSVLSHQRLTLQNDGRQVCGTVVDLDPEAGLILRRDSGELITLPSATTTVVEA